METERVIDKCKILELLFVLAFRLDLLHIFPSVLGKDLRHMNECICDLVPKMYEECRCIYIYNYISYRFYSIRPAISVLVIINSMRYVSFM